MWLLAVAIRIVKRSLTVGYSFGALLHEPLDLVAIRFGSEVDALLAEMNCQTLLEVHEPHVVMRRFAEFLETKAN